MISFEDWRFLVESIVYLLTGFKLDELPDENYYVNYENGMHVCDMAKIVSLNFNFYPYPYLPNNRRVC